MPFSAIEDIVNGDYDGKRVKIRGWVYRKRKSKDIAFLVIRDASGIIQCTVKKGSTAWADAEKASIESSIALEGTVNKDERSPQGFEISADQMKIIGLAETFPITKDQSEEFRRNVRHLWVRSQRMNAIMKIRSETLRLVHEFFREVGFIEVSPPMFISSACEGGSTLFDLKYFDNNLYLTQSAQLHLEALIQSLERVYCVAPSFRAEKSRTVRHLAEYWHIEAEEAFSTMDDLMDLEEKLVSYVCQNITRRRRKECKALGVQEEKLTKIKPPFSRVTYDKALKKLQEKGYKIKWGEDFGFDEERALADEFGPLFLYTYPKKIKAFYCKTYRDNPEMVMSVDLIVPNIGELSTGGAREDDKEQLLKRLEELGLKQEDYEWYIDLRRYGTVPHTGFGLGLERLLGWILDLENIMDTIPFPRTVRRFYP